MFAEIALALVINATPMQTHCDATFHSLLKGSVTAADGSRFVDAAALREGAANVYQACLLKGAIAHSGIYPFDGVGSFIIASTFWHLSGDDMEAERALSQSKIALELVQKRFSRIPHDSAYQGHLDLMIHMIGDRKHGKWGRWR